MLTYRYFHRVCYLCFKYVFNLGENIGLKIKTTERSFYIDFEIYLLKEIKLPCRAYLFQ